MGTYSMYGGKVCCSASMLTEVSKSLFANLGLPEVTVLLAITASISSTVRGANSVKRTISGFTREGVRKLTC